MYLTERGSYFGVKAFVHHLFWPIVAVGILHHLKIRNRDPARVAEKVRYQIDAFVVQYLVSVRGCGSIS